MKTLLPVVFVLLLGFAALARSVRDWSYQELTDGAELIVIATPVAVKDTTEKATIPGIQRSGVNEVGRPVPAIGVESTFEILSVLKGDKGLKTFVLYHLRETEKPEINTNGPGLVAFEPQDKKRYLLFLKREPDGRYSPLTGQTHPDMGVKELGKYP